MHEAVPELAETFGFASRNPLREGPTADRETKGIHAARAADTHNAVMRVVRGDSVFTAANRKASREA